MVTVLLNMQRRSGEYPYPFKYGEEEETSLLVTSQTDEAH